MTIVLLLYALSISVSPELNSTLHIVGIQHIIVELDQIEIINE